MSNSCAWAQMSEMVVELTKQVKDWGIIDVRAMTEAALRQGLSFYSFDELHFHAVVYAEMNDLLLNMLCAADTALV